MCGCTGRGGPGSPKPCRQGCCMPSSVALLSCSTSLRQARQRGSSRRVPQQKAVRSWHRPGRSPCRMLLGPRQPLRQSRRPWRTTRRILPSSVLSWIRRPGSAQRQRAAALQHPPAGRSRRGPLHTPQSQPMHGGGELRVMPCWPFMIIFGLADGVRHAHCIAKMIQFKTKLSLHCSLRQACGK